MTNSETICLAALRVAPLTRLLASNVRGPIGHWKFTSRGRVRLFNDGTIRALVAAGLAVVDGNQVRATI